MNVCKHNAKLHLYNYPRNIASSLRIASLANGDTSCDKQSCPLSSSTVSSVLSFLLPQDTVSSGQSAGHIKQRLLWPHHNHQLWPHHQQCHQQLIHKWSCARHFEQSTAFHNVHRPSLTHTTHTAGRPEPQKILIHTCTNTHTRLSTLCMSSMI